MGSSNVGAQLHAGYFVLLFLGLVMTFTNTGVADAGLHKNIVPEIKGIGVPERTPIRAAASGTVIIAAYTGGYGNYTCIDHGSGLSTCYGHSPASPSRRARR